MDDELLTVGPDIVSGNCQRCKEVYLIFVYEDENWDGERGVCPYCPGLSKGQAIGLRQDFDKDRVRVDPKTPYTTRITQARKVPALTAEQLQAEAEYRRLYVCRPREIDRTIHRQGVTKIVYSNKPETRQDKPT